MSVPSRRVPPLPRLLTLVLAVGLLAGCQASANNVHTLLDKSGTGSAKLPAFTASGLYDVAWSYDQCTGGVTGMRIDATVGNGKPDTLLQNAAPTGSGNQAGHGTGPVTLDVVTHCRWKVTVTG